MEKKYELPKEDIRTQNCRCRTAFLLEELVDEHGELFFAGQGAGMAEGRLQFLRAQELMASGRMGDDCPQALLGRDPLRVGQGTVQHNTPVGLSLRDDVLLHAIALAVVEGEGIPGLRTGTVYRIAEAAEGEKVPRRRLIYLPGSAGGQQVEAGNGLLGGGNADLDLAAQQGQAADLVLQVPDQEIRLAAFKGFGDHPQRYAQVGQVPDDREQVQVVIRVIPVAVGQAGRADEALFFIETDHVPGYAGGAGGIVDFHAGSPPICEWFCSAWIIAQMY